MSPAVACWVGGACLCLSIALCAAAPVSTRVDNPVVTVPVSGTVDGAPELVRFSGNLQVRSTLVRDLDGGKPPLVQLAIDLVDLVGRGLSSGARYVSRAEFVNSTELDAHEVIEFTFPFLPDSRKGHLVPRSGQIALTLRFDARNGAVIDAACRISGVQGPP
jgi:hypothetical protein